MDQSSKPPAFAREPLLAGVEDNPVYRLLLRKGNWRRSRIPELFKNRIGAGAFFNFKDWVWDDLDESLMEPRDFAQALWAIRADVSGRCRSLIVHFSVVIIALNLILNSLNFLRHSGTAISVGYIIGCLLLGYINRAVKEPATVLPLLIANVNVASTITGRRNDFDYLVFILFSTIACEAIFLLIPTSTSASAVIKLIAGGAAAFAIGSIAAWLYTLYIHPRREILFEKLTAEVAMLLELRNRESGRQ